MAILTESINTNGYSSTARKVLVLGRDGTSYASITNPVPVDAIVSVDSMSLNAEMKVNTGHDLYLTTTNVGDGTDTISFDSVTGLVLENIQAVENKTQGWVYNTEGSTVSTTSIVLDLTEQKTGYPVPGVADEFEIVYRGVSRLTDKTQMSQITDGTTEVDIQTGTYPALYTAPTDGTNTMPMMDSNARAGWMQLTDATTDADILPTGAAAEASGKLGVAAEIVDFDTSAGTDYTGAIGVLGASINGAVPLKLNPLGEQEVAVDGVYNVADNVDPDNVGIIVHSTSTNPTDAEQIVRTTGGADDTLITSTDFHGMDVRAKLYGVVSTEEAEIAAIDIGSTYGVGVGLYDASGNRMPPGDIVARSVFTAIGDGTNTGVVLTDGADATANTVNEIVTGSMSYVFNGTTWDRLRSVGTGILSTDITTLGAETLGDHGTAVIDHGIQPLYEAKDFDGSALPNIGAEGQAVRPAASLSGVQYSMLVNEAGTDTPLVADSAVISAANGGTVGFMLMGQARSTQRAAVTEDDAVRPAYSLYGEQIIKGHDYSTNSNRVEETDPISSHHVEETLAAVTNGADATYYYYFDMDGAKHFTTQLILNGGSGTATVTCEVTIQDDGTAPASCTYVDVTNDLFGAATFVASNMLIADQNYGFKYVRYKVVAATGAADDADWTIYNKKLY